MNQPERNRSGTGPFFGQKANHIETAQAENMDLSPSVAPRGMVTAIASRCSDNNGFCVAMARLKTTATKEIDKKPCISAFLTQVMLQNFSDER